MLFYYTPAMVFSIVYFLYPNPLCLVMAAILFGLATLLIPGYMSHYCVAFDAAQIFNVCRSFMHVFSSGGAYWHAWGIAIAALVLSFAGFLLVGVGFLFTSVWFWQVAGFSFASVMVQQHSLAHETSQKLVSRSPVTSATTGSNR